MQAQGVWPCAASEHRGVTVVLVIDGRGEQKVKMPQEREGRGEWARGSAAP
jgi:hypothetical protein